MTNSVVAYALDETTTVQFEIEPSTDFQPASPDEISGRIREAVEPALRAARAVLEQVREAAPSEVKLKFGIKASGTANWFVAKAATEGNFEVEMVWKPATVGQR